MLSLSEDLPMLRVVWLWVLAPRYAVRRARYRIRSPICAVE